MHTVTSFQTRAQEALWGTLAFFGFSGLAAQVPVPDQIRGLVYPAALVRALTERWVYLEADLMLSAILRLLVVFGCIWLAGFAMLNICHGLLTGMTDTAPDTDAQAIRTRAVPPVTGTHQR